eukprot:Platyproteum_vivax@DN8548_c0_g1_i1.p1
MQTLRFANISVQSLGLLYLIHEYGFDFSTAVGPSMVPLFRRAGDVVIIDKFSHKIWGIQPGSVVIAKSVESIDTRVCKRVIAKEGEAVRAEVRGLYSLSNFGAQMEMTVPKGHLWVEGDNPSESYDSRHYGPIPEGMVLGTVALQIWPLNKIRFIKPAPPPTKPPKPKYSIPSIPVSPSLSPNGPVCLVKKEVQPASEFSLDDEK